MDDPTDAADEADPDIVRLVRVRLHEGDDSVVEGEICRLVVVETNLVTDA